MRGEGLEKREWCGDGPPSDKRTGTTHINARQAWKAVPLATTVSQGRIGAAMSQDINVLALVKGEERYVFLYDDASRAETLRTLGRYASNPD